MKIGTKNRIKQNQRGIPITLEMVKAAYKNVRGNGKAAGIDGVTLKQFQEKEEANLYVVYNRMSSGTYFPPGIKRVKIPKSNGKTRNLGIPTVRDRVAQTVIKKLIEHRIDNTFCEESYGCRPRKSAHQALDSVRKKCWRKAWVIDLDVKDYFNTIDHELLMRAVDMHVEEKWIKMYIRRWLEAPVITSTGVERTKGKGTPQGGVLSPLLANLFLHYALDKWLKQKHPQIEFTRYMDDVIVQCKSQEEAVHMLTQIKKRLVQCKLELNENKTCIVYCKSEDRKGNYPKVTFDFLGYTFKPTASYNRREKRKFLGFNPEISTKSQKKIVAEIRGNAKRMNVCKNIEELAKLLNPSIRGWLNYYGHIRKSAMSKVFFALNRRIMTWLRKKYKKLRSKKKSLAVMQRLRTATPTIFAHWAAGFF
jgi:group II intron reverse transcriptase/maturase